MAAKMAAKKGLFGYRAKILSYCGDKHKSGDLKKGF